MDNQVLNPYGNSKYCGNDDFFYQNYKDNHLDERNINQGFNVGLPQAMTIKQLRYLTIPQIVSKSFLFMFAALLITALAAFTTSSDTALRIATNKGTLAAIVIVELIVVLISNYAIHNNLVAVAGILYIIYSYLTGTLFSVIFHVCNLPSITSVFLISAAIFAVMAVYGMITKRDLSSVGNICFMGLVGIIITGAVNMFVLKSSGLDLIITCIGVFIFIALTAYDVQQIKARAQSSTEGNATSLALFGGFELYLDFVNIFLRILRLSSRD